MKIGTKEMLDICPTCNKPLLKKPLGRTVKESSSHSFSHFSMWCPNCNFETESVKIRDDYRDSTLLESKDVTPYKKGFFARLFR
jgi:hypothetical protein